MTDLETITQEIFDRSGWVEGERIPLNDDCGIADFAQQVLPPGAVLTQATFCEVTGKPRLEINYQRPAMN